jgi:hypothetical protein
MSWWVSWQPDAPSGQPPYVILNQAAKPAPFVAGRVDGPYSSQAAAQQAASTATPPPSTAAASNSPSLPSPFTDVAHALTAFYDVLTNGKMWRSLAWLLGGILLMGIGAVMLIEQDIPLPPIIPV